MKSNPEPLTHISRIKAYKAGKNSPEGITPMVKMSSNESPWGPSPAVLRFLQKNVNALHRYPLSQDYVLRDKIAALYGLSAENVVLGNGSNEIIQFVISAYAGAKKEIIVPEITFSMYQIYAEIAGTKVRKASMDDLAVDLNSLKSMISAKTAAIFLASPNNPTGMVCDKKKLLEFISSVPESVLIVLDEAYAEFCDQKLLIPPKKLIRVMKKPNIIIMRTFSKLYGLAALRIGYGLTSSTVAGNLHRVRQHFNTNNMAHLAAVKSLEQPEYYQGIVDKVIKGRKYLEQQLSNLRVQFEKSQANFITIKVQDALAAENILFKSGFIVRNLSSFGMKNYLRITVDKMLNNKKLISIIKNNINFFAEG